MIKVNAYQNSYYTIILLPIGLCIYLVIKFGSDFHMSNKGFTINSFDNNYNRELLSNEFLVNVVHEAQKLNDINLMFSSLPVMTYEINFIKISNRKSKEQNVRYDYISTLLYFYEFGFTNKGIILEKHVEDRFNVFAARLLYNEYIEHGNIQVNNCNNIAKLINSNRIIPSSNISIKEIETKIRKSVIKVVNLNLSNHKIFENRMNLTKKGNAVIFLYQLNGLIKVIDC